MKNKLLLLVASFFMYSGVVKSALSSDDFKKKVKINPSLEVVLFGLMAEAKKKKKVSPSRVRGMSYCKHMSVEQWRARSKTIELRTREGSYGPTN